MKYLLLLTLLCGTASAATCKIQNVSLPTYPPYAVYYCTQGSQVTWTISITNEGLVVAYEAGKYGREAHSLPVLANFSYHGCLSLTKACWKVQSGPLLKGQQGDTLIIEEFDGQ